MASVHDSAKANGTLARLLTTDFCPWANRFVYWLKEPIGWFFLATLICVIIGMYFAPIGWTLAACLTAVMVVGVAWPWVAVRCVVCSLGPESEHVHEDDACHLILKIRNRLPLPVWGLAVEGYLDRDGAPIGEESESIPTVALAYVRTLSVCTYRFSIQPQMRGRYPNSGASITCSFPFGIWQAKRPLKDIAPITVWPKVYPILGQNSMTGLSRAEHGEGNRVGRTGDFIGVREYRRGDSAKQVNWIATARARKLIVTERGGPQCPALQINVDTSAGHTRDAIADRIRVAASLLANLHHSDIPLFVRIGRQKIAPRRGREGFVQMMELLTDVPHNGDSSPPMQLPGRGVASITILSDEFGNPTVHTVDPVLNPRLDSTQQGQVIQRDIPLTDQLAGFWTEVRDANLVA